MRRNLAHVYLTGALAAVLLSMSQGSVNHPPVVMAAPNPHYSAAISRLEQEDVPGAMSALNQALQLNPSLAEAYTLRGILLMSKKQFQPASDDFAQVTRLQPNSVEAHIHLAQSQMALKNFQGALQSATIANQLDPQNQTAALLVQMIPHLAKPSS